MRRDRSATRTGADRSGFRLGADGVTWGLVGNSVTENGTVEHIEALLKAAKERGYDVFVSPHYYYPSDSGWQFGGTVENMMHEIHMFDRKGPSSMVPYDAQDSSPGFALLVAPRASRQR